MTKQANAMARAIVGQMGEESGDEVNVNALTNAIEKALPTIRLITGSTAGTASHEEREDDLVAFRVIVEEDDNTFWFDCRAEDWRHAKEQAANAYADARVVRVVRFDDLRDSVKAFLTIQECADILAVPSDYTIALSEIPKLRALILKLEAERDEARQALPTKAHLMEMQFAGLSFSDCVEVFGETDKTSAFVRAARHLQEDGTLEFDHHVVVSRGDDDGAYVLAWQWIANAEADEHQWATCIEHAAERVKPTARGAMIEIVAWAEDLVSNHADEIDDIHVQLPLAEKPAPLRWLCADGVTTIDITPSAALKDLCYAAAMVDQGDQEPKIAHLMEFIESYGEQLDLILTSVPIPERL